MRNRMEDMGGSSEELMKRIPAIKLDFWKLACLGLAIFVCIKGFTINHKMEVVVTHKTDVFHTPEVRISSR